MLAATVAVVALALFGHAALWVGLVNRWHATGFPRKVVKSITLLFYLALLTIPLAVTAYLIGYDGSQFVARPLALNWATLYIALCAAYGAVHGPLWLFHRLRAGGLPPGVCAGQQHVVDIARQLGAAPASGPRTKLFSRLPFNQLWHLHVSDFVIRSPRVPAALGELSICHLSDLHFSGRIERGYYDEVVRQTNDLQADLIVLTGDICDHRRYFEWIPETLGRLHARLGKFFILGNHDLRTKAVDHLREVMCAAGFTDVGGRHALVSGGSLLLAGNERPWFPDSLPELNGAPGDAFRILLAHTPDQFAWAQQQRYDLMLAGHTHGGQIRFPLVGPVVCPSWHGTRFASGFFHQSPTLMHVSRGTAGLFPYRLNCPPEITRLILRRG